jgi:imidazolonepropionase-like amidohydrolase/Tol biopolymer transport system component
MKGHFFRTLLGGLAWAALGGAAAAGTLEFKTTRVTEADVALSPDGKHLAFTILGHLFLLPSTGGTAEQLTFGTCYDSAPAFSPDGRRLAFVSDRDKSGGNVFLLELAGKKVTQLTHETHAGQPAWAPDGTAILYLRFLPLEENPRPRSLFARPALCDLRTVSLDKGAKPRVLRAPGFLKSIFFLSREQPAWTVVEQEAGGGGFMARSTTHIETLTAKDGKVSRLRSVQGDLGWVVGSPKGGGLYYGSPQVRFLSLAEGAARPAPNPGPGPGGPARAFAVTADGKAAYQSGRGQLVRVTLADGEREVIPFGARVRLEVADPVRPKWDPPEVGGAVPARGVLNPELSPDGRSLTFMAGGYLWRQTLDGQPARRLLGGDAWECEPALSPDGRLLAFVRCRQGKRELRLLDLASGKDRTLADLEDGSRARFPSWSGDGKRLVFQKSGALQSPFELVSVNVSDGKRETLARPAGDWSSRPHFAPAGDAIYFTSRTDGPGSLYRLPLGGKAGPDTVTRLARHLNEARVSPDGKWLAFRRNTEVWVAPLGTGPVEEKDARRLSPEGGATFGFTPGSSAVICSVGGRVWRHALDGGQPREFPVRLEWRCPAPPPLLLRRVRVLDFAAGQFGGETSLLVERGAIRWVGPERGHHLPGGVTVLDAAGRYAIPGLFDFHVHSAWANQEAHPDTFLAYGITSVRDTGGGLETLCALADRGDVSGDPVPRYFFSGEIFEGAQPTWGDAFLQIYGPGEARDHVKRWKERGAHFVKLYSSLPWSLHHAAAEEARRQGIPVVGHGLSLEEIVKSVTLGYASLEHCPLSLNEDVKLMLAAAGTRCDPTLAILGGHGNLLRREPARLDDAKLRAFFTESFIRASGGGGFPGMGANWPARLAELRDAHRAGVRLHAGTDSLMTGTFFGQSLHWELEHLAEAGLTPLEVLRIATEEAARAVGAGDHLGSLAPGKLADVVLLDADPLENIRNTQAIWRVVKGGRVYDPGELRPARPGK